MDEANQMCPETFESLIVTVKTKMYKTAIAILKNDEDACDAIQEAEFNRLIDAVQELQSNNNQGDMEVGHQPKQGESLR